LHQNISPTTQKLVIIAATAEGVGMFFFSAVLVMVVKIASLLSTTSEEGIGSFLSAATQFFLLCFPQLLNPQKLCSLPHPIDLCPSKEQINIPSSLA
jgi:hypothetical protein